MKLRLLRKAATLKADGKKLVFEDGVCEVKKLTKDLEFLVKNGYLEVIKDGKAISK